MSEPFLNFGVILKAEQYNDDDGEVGGVSDLAFSTNTHTTSIIETETFTETKIVIPNNEPAVIKAVDATISSFPTYLSDFAQPESGSNGFFGWFLAVSDDGLTILVSDYLAHGNSLTDNGAIWCFEYSNSSWSQKGSTIYGPVANGRLGEDLHLSGDGNTIYAGSPQSVITDLYIYTYNTSTSEWNSAQTISGTWRGQIRSNYDGTILIASQPGHSTISNQRGRALVYEYSGGSWSQKGSDIDGQESGSLLHGVAMTPDGTQIAITERSKGRYKVFTYDTSTSDWVQKGSTLTDFDNNDATFAIDLSDDGNTLAVGAYSDDTDGRSNNGSIKIYTYDTDWTLITTISGGQNNDFIAFEAVSLSADGTTVAFSERRSSSSNLARVRVFRNENNDWIEIFTETIPYDGGNAGITCRMSRNKQTLITHYRDTSNSNKRTLYLAHSYNNGRDYYSNLDSSKPHSYKALRLMPSTNPKSGYLDLLSNNNNTFEMNVHGETTIQGDLTVNSDLEVTGGANVGGTGVIDELLIKKHFTTIVGLGHRDCYSTNNNGYALAQDLNGTTYINCGSGQGIYFRSNNNNTPLYITGAGSQFYREVELTTGTELKTNGSYGTSGEVLTSRGSGSSPIWASPSIAPYIFITKNNDQAITTGSFTERLVLNTVDVTSTGSNAITLDTNTGRITINETGIYKMDAMISADATGSNRVVAAAQLRKNGTYLAPYECYAYCRISSSGENTASLTGILSLSSSDYLEIYVARSLSEGVKIITKGTGISLMKIA